MAATGRPETQERFHSGKIRIVSRFGRVEMWRGGGRLGLLLPPLSSGGASIAEP
jgi:hypothetical protein